MLDGPRLAPDPAGPRRPQRLPAKIRARNPLGPETEETCAWRIDHPPYPALPSATLPPFSILPAINSSIERIKSELKQISAMLDESADLRRLVASPVFSADDQERAVGAVADKAAIKGLAGNFLQLVARNRRLFALPGIIKAFGEMAARHRGEVTAEVTSAHALNDTQVVALKKALKDKLGKDVMLQARVNPALLGGLIVKVGSRMIDTSLRTRLMNVKMQLKEVG